MSRRLDWRKTWFISVWRQTNASVCSRDCVSISVFKQDTSILIYGDNRKPVDHSHCVSSHWLTSVLESSHPTTNTSIYRSNRNQNGPRIADHKVKCAALVVVVVLTYLLFPPLLPLVLRVLQHLLSPQVKEVGRVGVELQAFFPVVPADGQKRRRNRIALWLLCSFFFF